MCVCLFLNIFFSLKIDNLKKNFSKKQKKKQKNGKEKKEKKKKKKNVKIHTAMLSSRNAFSRDLLYSSSLSFIFFTIFFFYFFSYILFSLHNFLKMKIFHFIRFFLRCFIKKRRRIRRNTMVHGVFLIQFLCYFFV